MDIATGCRPAICRRFFVNQSLSNKLCNAVNGRLTALSSATHLAYHSTVYFNTYFNSRQMEKIEGLKNNITARVRRHGMICIILWGN